MTSGSPITASKSERARRGGRMAASLKLAVVRRIRVGQRAQPLATRNEKKRGSADCQQCQHCAPRDLEGIYRRPTTANDTGWASSARPFSMPSSGI